MSALPSTPIPSGWEAMIEAATNRYLASLGLTPERINAERSGLSLEEVKVIPPAAFRPKKRVPVVTLEDCPLLLDRIYQFNGLAVELMAHYQKRVRGRTEDGAPVEPDTPAGWIVDEVWLVNRDRRVEITDVLSKENLDEAQDYLDENCEPNGSDD